MKRITLQIQNEDFEKIAKRAEAHNISVSEYVRSLIEREVGSDQFDSITFDMLYRDGEISRIKRDISFMRKVSMKMLNVLDQMETEIKDCTTTEE